MVLKKLKILFFPFIFCLAIFLGLFYDIYSYTKTYYLTKQYKKEELT